MNPNYPCRTRVGWPDRSWVPAATRTIVLLGPDGIQYRFGQEWLACAIIPAQVGYTGSLHVGASRSAADAYGLCRLGSGGEPVPNPCDSPHEIEIFGAAVGTGSAVPTWSAREWLC
jgi:hypothetical protein